MRIEKVNLEKPKFDGEFFWNNFSYVYFVSKVSLHFWNLHKTTPMIAYFKKKKITSSLVLATGNFGKIYGKCQRTPYLNNPRNPFVIHNCMIFVNP
jgi:hypothetical protein